MQYDVALHLKEVLNEEISILKDEALLVRQLDPEHLIRCGRKLLVRSCAPNSQLCFTQTIVTRLFYLAHFFVVVVV